MVFGGESGRQPQPVLELAPITPRPCTPEPQLLPIQPAPESEPARESPGWWKRAWKRIAGQGSVPGFVRWVAVLLPLLIVPWLRFEGGPARQALLESSADRSPGRLAGIRQAVARRAATRLEDDFRSGLGAWRGEAKWAETWSYDAAGFVQPGKLALWEPSLRLADYRLDFLAQIERGGLSWAFRARDPANYHAARLVVLEAGPFGKAALLRHTVIEGKAGPRERTPLPFALGRTSMQHVRLEVRGPAFSLYVNGQLVGYWTDERLPAGGIGFFAESGERYRLRRVTVSHQDDLLGRLCAFLVPPTADRESRSQQRP